MSFPLLLRKASGFVVRNSHTILTGFGITGFIGTVVLAIKASPTAKLIVDDLKEEYEEKFQRGEVATPDVPKMEIIKGVAPVYLPMVVMGGASIACVIGGASVMSRKNMALASLYSAAQLSAEEYRDKVVKVLGEEKEQKVRDELARDRIERTPVSSSQVIITGKGETLCFDTLSGRYLMIEIEKIRRAEIDINRSIIVNMYMSLNEWYYRLGLPPIDLGEDQGWNVDNQLEISFSSHVTDDDRPCLVIQYLRPPVADYRKVI